MLHKASPTGENHVPYNWTYTSAAVRLAATGFVASDIGKLARDTDTNTLWMLTNDVTPTWIGLSDFALLVAKTSATGSAQLPVGTTAQRDVTPNDGYTRFNSTLNTLESWYSSAWNTIVTTANAVLTIGAQSIAGIKTFTDGIKVSSTKAIDFLGTEGLMKVAGTTLVTLRTTGLQVPAATASTDAVQLGQTVGKNKIIGGDFSTNPWQRGTSFTAPANTVYTADRFLVSHSTDGVVDILKTADAPTVTQAGIFTQHCLHADVTTADAAIAAGQYYIVYQKIEGLNSKSFGFGQAGTRYVTLSFWHKHTKTGINCISIQNSAQTRSYIAEYTQAVSDTWEKSTITIPVDTAGTWLYDTGIGLRVDFILAMGSTYHTAANAWTTGLYFSTANQVNNLDSIANNFKIALVQLEDEQVATQFEDLTAQEVEDLCYRYTQPVLKDTSSRVLGIANSAAAVQYPYQFFKPMRAAPTLSANTGSVSVNNIGTGGSGATVSPYVTIAVAGTTSCQFSTATTAGAPTMVGGDGCQIYLNSAVPLLLFAEL